MADQSEHSSNQHRFEVKQLLLVEMCIVYAAQNSKSRAMHMYMVVTVEWDSALSIASLQLKGILVRIVVKQKVPI
jgi:hypothetical protein